MKMYGRSRTLCYFALPALLLAACMLQPTSAQAQMTSVGIDCSQIQALGILKQDNMRAGRVLIDCGLVQGGRPGTADSRPPAPPNIRVSSRACSNAQNCTKSESMVWASSVDPTIVVNYNDHNANQYSGTSYSTDGGTTFTEILPPPFGSGHGTNFGDPIVVFNAKLGMWFAGDLATGCGGQGIGLWTSNDGITWTVGACAHNGGSDDRESMWVDNEPTMVPASTGPCEVANPVKVAQGAVPWNQPAVMSCTLAERVDRFLTEVVEPLARSHLGTAIARMDNFGAYSCRREVGQAGRWSEHAAGRAIDVSGFLTADGGRVSVEQDWNRPGPKRDFLRAVASRACDYFSVVLSPESDRYHYNHLHLDIGRWRLCQTRALTPASPPGAPAARAAAATGSAGSGRSP